MLEELLSFTLLVLSYSLHAELDLSVSCFTEAAVPKAVLSPLHRLSRGLPPLFWFTPKAAEMYLVGFLKLWWFDSSTAWGSVKIHTMSYTWGMRHEDGQGR